jgi:phosphoglycerol transferase MdoB-like AlkP superfamily enzyme
MEQKPIQQRLEQVSKQRRFPVINFLAERAYSVIIIVALLFTLLVKLYHALRYQLIGEYYSWILSDISFLLFIEVILALVCFRWPRKWVVRTAVIIAAILCTWSVLNAGWLIKTGSQLLPRVFLSLVRSPLSALYMIGVNFIKMPQAAASLAVPSAIAIIFFIYVMARPRLPHYNRSIFFKRIIVCLLIVLAALIARPYTIRRHSMNSISADLLSNAQLKAVMSLVVRDYSAVQNPKRKIPLRDQIEIGLTGNQTRQNLIIVVLEGVQYKYTSLADDSNNVTPFLKKLASQGVEFSNTRSILTHTTKALFALLTGRFPSASQDLAEAVPAIRPYASIATILSDKLGYRTAFFQSARGNFEARPGLVYNLGFEKFWTRDDLGDPNCFVGYLGCDEFAMLQPIAQWIQEKESPFFLTILCSVTHDPYEVPEWFGTPTKEKTESYRQTISYTDSFLAALDVEISRMKLSDETVLCVIGDHGEAFGEHGQLGHNRIAFDEALCIPFCLRAPFFVKPATRITGPASSVDLTPTLLSLLGFDTKGAGFDGINVLEPIAADRRIYFCGWMQEGPAGYIQNNFKYTYDPINKTTLSYNLATDPQEQVRLEVPKQQAEQIANDILSWRKGTILKINQKPSGSKIVFKEWFCHWTQRVSSAKYRPQAIPQSNENMLNSN